MKKSKIDEILKIGFNIVILSAIIFLIYIGFISKTTVSERRIVHEVSEYNDLTMTIVNDDTSPTKIKRVYQGTIDNPTNLDDCLVFYVSHSYVKVFIDNNLVYEISSSNSAVSTVGNNYVVVPIQPEDNNKTLSIEITPIYNDFINKDIEFYKGSWESIYIKAISSDYVQLILSFVCIAIGISLILFVMALMFNHTYTNKLGYLGVFILSLGLWKLCDMRCTPLLFSKYPVIISYISLISLYVAPLSFLIYIDNRLDKERFNVLKYASGIAILVPLVSILLEVLKVCEIRELLIINHIGLIIYLCSLIYACIKDCIQNKSIRKIDMLVFTLVLGVALDLIVYYIDGSSNSTIFLLIAVIYNVLSMAINSLKELRYKSNVDGLTGLNNNNKCKEIIEQDKILTEEIGFLVFDLNGLKATNDKLGHTYGDELIANFGDLLKRNVPKESFCGRFGGDEFIVILYDTKEKDVQKFLDTLKAKTDIYNQNSDIVKISYSVGYVMASSLENPTMKAIFNKADELMYKQKEEYYKTHNRRRK